MTAITNNLDRFATAIRERRKVLRLSQQDVADLCGVQRQTIGRLERADPTVSLGTALAVADQIGLPISDSGTETLQ